MRHSKGGRGTWKGGGNLTSGGDCNGDVREKRIYRPLAARETSAYDIVRDEHERPRVPVALGPWIMIRLEALISRFFIANLGMGMELIVATVYVGAVESANDDTRSSNKARREAACSVEFEP